MMLITKNYGGRGIALCERWENYDNFIADMGYRPEGNYQIDRIDNDGDYTPENCEWVTQKENRRHTQRSAVDAKTVVGIRAVRMLTALTLAEIGELYNVNPFTVSAITNGRSWTDIIQPVI